MRRIFLIIGLSICGISTLSVAFSSGLSEDQSHHQMPLAKSFPDIRKQIFDIEFPAVDSQHTMPSVWCDKITDEKTKSKCWEAFTVGLDYYREGLPQRIKVFYWQHVTTQIIFFVVILLVFAGIFFSWLQFRREAQFPDNESTKGHSIEVTKTGIKVSSPVLGVIILALSLAFFYLYLVHVYPIQEIF